MSSECLRTVILQNLFEEIDNAAMHATSACMAALCFIGARFMKNTLLVISIILLVGCAAPERIEKEYAALGRSCVEVGKGMGDVEGCLNLEFTKSIYQGQIVKSFIQCRPYWGWPFVQSCGGINVIYSESEVVTRWYAWGVLDGV